jgi:hypothetical protein
MIRVYITPWVGTGTRADRYRSKAEDFGYNLSCFFPSKSDGTPASLWVVAIIRSDDFSVIEADLSCDDLFGGDLPATVNTRDDLIALLRGRTVSDVPLARRNAIIAVLDKYTITRADFTGQTPLWKVMQRVVSTLFEQDDNFASNF